MAIDTSKTIASSGRRHYRQLLVVRRPCARPTSATPAAKCSRPSPVDYFSFFGLPRKLNLDTAHLEREFYELSRKLHPDLNARADKREQEWSLEQSSLLNDAYRTLKDPIKRTQYLLQLEGVELEEQSKTRNREGARQRRSQETDCASRFAGGSVRTEHATRRTAHEEKDGRRRSRAGRRKWKAQSWSWKKKYEDAGWRK